MRIGVVIPAYDAAAWIGEAIASVLAQTHGDWVLVVVDDGSTDGTGEIVAHFADSRVRLIRQANAGASAARNRGIVELLGGAPTPTLPRDAGEGVFRPLSRAAGEGWGRGVPDSLLFLDADDFLAPAALFRLAGALEADPGAVAAVGAYTFVATGRARQPPSGDILERLLVRNLFANGGHLLIRAEAVRAARGFLPALSYGEDWDCWIRIAQLGRFVAARGEPVLFVRQHAGGAYRRLASDPAAFVPCMDAIFASPALLGRFGSARLADIRRRGEAENHWIVGRELIRHGDSGEGRARLRRSVRSAPHPRRVALLAVAHVLALLPERFRGPFRAYRPAIHHRSGAPHPV